MYLCKNLRISCLAAPSSSHDFANSTFNFSALLLTSCPFSLRHKSMVCRTSIPTASRDPTGVIPFLCRALRPSPLLTWKSSKLAWRFSVTCAAAIGWSPTSGKKILQKKRVKSLRWMVKSEENAHKGIPLARDSVTLLKPPCEMNHPVAYGIF